MNGSQKTPTAEAIAGLERTQRVLYAVSGMIDVLKNTDESGLQDGALENFADALTIILGPACEAIEKGIAALQPEPGGAAT